MVNNNNYKVEGAKAGDKPRQPNIAKDSVSSISTAKILYGLNDGEISGIVGGGKGIKLEDTPLLDEAGKENFKGVKWDFRAGTLDQEYIEGFPDISNETGVGVELKGGVDWIKAISNPVLSAVRIRLSWNGLRKQNTENGDVSGYKIDYAVDVKTGSGAYIEVLKTNINDKVTGKYERTHRIALPKSSSGWQIRVRRLTPNANLDNVQDKMFIESITEVIDQKFTYPHTSLLGIQYDAKTFSRIAKLAVRCKGKLIKIPSNYDTTSNTYTGVWNGQFKLEYSNNPAWIFYDLVTSKRYGLGKRIDPSMVDKWSLYDLGAYCDALVPDGQGSTEKRYTCNVYLQSQAEAYQILSQLSGIFRAITYWSGQQLVLSADVPKDPTYTFSRANVIDGQFEYTGTRARDRHTVAKVAFDNPKENFKTEYEYIRDEAGIAKFGINVIDISAIGCTSRGQAQRAGLWALKSEQLETRTVTFRTGLEGFNLLVGEVIEVSDELLAGRANGGRITAVDATFKKVTVDREAVIKVNDFITVNAKDGNSQRRKVTAVSGKVVTVLTPFVAVEAGAVWAISSVDLNTMQFRVMSIKPDEDNIFAITAIQHEPLKYAAVDHGASVKPTNISIIKPTNVAPPATVALSANYRVVQGQSVATLVIQWSQVKDAVGYSVEWRRNDGNWIKLPLTGNVSAEVEGVYEGNYQARVKSVNAFDVESDFTNSIVTNIKGKVGSPKALASISATGILFGMDIKWNFLAGSEDTNYTEIQTATNASGANTALLGSFSYPTDKTTVNGLQGGLTVFYRGRIVDKLGNAGNWSAWVSGTTDNNAGKVLQILTGQITESQLYKDLNTKIDKIGTNSTAIGGINTGLDKAKADIIEANNVITANKLEAANAVAAANLEISKTKADIVAANKLIADNKLIASNAVAAANTEIAASKVIINSNKAEITASRTELNTAKTQLATAITNINTANTNIANSKLLIDANKAKLVLTDAEVAAAKTKVTALETDYNGNKTSVSNALTVLTNKDKSLATDITTLTANYGASEAKLVQDLKVLTDKDTSLTSTLTALSTDYNGNKTAVSNSLTALTNKDTALVNQVTALDTDYKGNKTSVANQLTALSTKDTAIVNDVNALKTKTDNTNAEIVTVKNLVSDNTSSIANTKTEITAAYKQAIDDIEIGGRNLLLNSNKTVNNNSYLMNTYTVSEVIPNNQEITITVWGKLSPTRKNFRAYKTDGASLVTLNDLGNDIHRGTVRFNNPTDAMLGIRLYQTNSTDTGDSTVYRIKLEKGNKATDYTLAPEDTEAAIAVNTASITAEAVARVDADKAITASVTTLKSDYDANKASVTQSLGTLTTKDTALTNQLTALTSTVGTNTATITANNNTLVAKDKAIADSVTALDTKYEGNKTSVSSQLTALVNKDTATANQLTALDTDYKGNKTAVSNSLTSLTNADTALGSRITTLDTDYKGNKTTVSNSLTALTNADTALGSRITTLDTDYKGNKTAVTNSLTALSNKDIALTNSITSLTATVGTNTSSIGTLNTAMSTANSAIANTKTDLTAKFNEAKDYADLKSSVLVISSNTKKFINPASYSVDTATITGYLVIETPITPARMVNLKLSGFNYSSSSTVGLNLSFYNYSSSFINTGYESTGRYTIDKVQLAKKDADKKAVIIIGLPTSTWNYPKLVLEEVIVGYGSSPDSYLNEFSISVTTDISAYTNISNVSGVDIQNTLVETNAAITTEATARATADNAITSSVTTLKSDYDANKASVTSSLSTLTSKDTALTNSINALTTRVGTAESTITTNNTASVNKDTALTNSLNALTTRVGTAEGTITSNNTALVAKDTALTNSLNALTTRVGNNTSAISTEATTRTNADNALSTRITTAQSKADSAFTKITTAETTIASNTQAITKTRTDLTATYDSLEIGGRNLFIISASGITKGKYLRVDDTQTSSTSWAISDYIPVTGNQAYMFSGFSSISSPTNNFYDASKVFISAVSGNNRISMITPSNAAFMRVSYQTKDVNTTKVEKGNKATDWTPAPEDIDAAIAVTDAAISSEATARANADNALSTRINTVTATAGTNKTSISTEITARSTADTALGNRITATDAIAKNAQSRVGTAETALSNANSAIATLRTDLVASYTIADTRATDELPQYYYSNFPRQTVQEFKNNSVFTGVIGTGTYILLETIVKWSSTSGGSITQKAITDDNRFYIRMSKSATVWGAWLEQEDVVGSAAKVEAVRKALDTKINTTDARVTSEKTVAANATSAVASTVSGLKTTVNGHTSSIATQATSLNGLSAQYTVKVDVGGRVSGFGLASTAIGAAPKSAFAVNADQFYIAPPTGTSKGVTPFMVTTTTTTINGVSVPAGTYIESAHIHNGSIDIAKIRTASITSLQALTANIGHFKSAPTGARLEIKDSLLSVYDANNKLRVRLGLW